MRIVAELIVPSSLVIPTDHQFISAAVYAFLSAADPVRARELHENGYAWEHRRYKPYAFSRVVVPRRCSQYLENGDLLAHQCVAHWFVSSPFQEVLDMFTMGLLMKGHLELGAVRMRIKSVQTEPTPTFQAGFARLACMTPIVTTTRVDDKRLAQFVTQRDDPQKFSENIRLNLAHKYAAFFGRDAADPSLTIRFDDAFMKKHRGVEGTRFKNETVIGASAPFVVVGSPELIQLGYDCGFGQKNALGFGMVRVNA